MSFVQGGMSEGQLMGVRSGLGDVMLARSLSGDSLLDCSLPGLPAIPGCPGWIPTLRSMPPCSLCIGPSLSVHLEMEDLATLYPADWLCLSEDLGQFLADVSSLDW